MEPRVSARQSSLHVAFNSINSSFFSADTHVLMTHVQTSLSLFTTSMSTRSQVPASVLSKSTCGNQGDSPGKTAVPEGEIKNEAEAKNIWNREGCMGQLSQFRQRQRHLFTYRWVEAQVETHVFVVINPYMWVNLLCEYNQLQRRNSLVDEVQGTRRVRPHTLVDAAPAPAQQQ